MKTSLPKDSMPRERLNKLGPEALSDYELLAIILRTGTKDKNVLDLAKDMLANYQGLHYLNNVTLEELKNNKGIKEAKAIEILASIEFGKRVCLANQSFDTIKSSDDVYQYVRYNLENLNYEVMECVFINVKGSIVGIKRISIGNSNSTSADYREIAKWCFKYSCFNVILIHNHPSGDPTPSYNDKIFTNGLTTYLNKIGLTLVDHIIIGKEKYYSFSLKKEINKI